MSRPAVRVEGLWKEYVIGSNRSANMTLRESLTEAVKAPLQRIMGRSGEAAPEERFWALRDVSFEVQPGEVVGIIGRNGAGKSTLLKILSRITAPTKGKIEIRGRVASLLEVGTGFHPELTGRENIRLNGAILGMTGREITRKFDEIVDFAGVEKFIDTPVKRYSSGMYVRLAFAVAAHLDPEILVIDEVLAVGDAEFQRKCLGKMGEIAGKGGRTVLFVSHNMSAIEQLCARSLLMGAGAVAGDGPSREIVAQHLGATHSQSDFGEPVRIDSNVTLRRFHLLQPACTSAPLTLEMVLDAENPSTIKELAVVLETLRGVRVAILDMRLHCIVPQRIMRGETTLQVHIAALPLVEGTYSAGIFISTDVFAGDKLDLMRLRVRAGAPRYPVIEYPPAARGVVDLEYVCQLSCSPRGQRPSSDRRA